jgi:hypothetical protein
MLLLSVACTMVSLFVVPFASAFIFFSSLLSSLPPAAAYQCHIDNTKKALVFAVNKKTPINF